MNRVLITGANGFTGSHLIPILKASDWGIIPLSHHPSGYENEIIVDFRSKNFPEVLSQLTNVDAVIHLGTRVGWSVESMDDLFEPNVSATGKLVKWARERDAYFIFASAALIGGIDNTYITQDTPANPSGAYLYSKFLAEEVIKMSGISSVRLRIAGIFGYNGPSHLGINKAITEASKGRPPLLYGSGKIKRNYIYVDDLCHIIRYCLENRPEGIRMACGSEVNTVAEMLESICRVFIPDQTPEKRAGGEGQNQIIEPSPDLPAGRSFEESLRHIKERYT